MHRPIDEIRADLEDCANCKTGRDCMSFISNCEKPHTIAFYKVELIAAITADIPLDRLEQICKAEQEGRVVVLPVPIGYPVYKINDGEPYEECISCAGNPRGCSYAKHGTCCNVWTKCGYAVTYVEFGYHHIPLWGKTVFLTREAAAAALQEGQTNGM